MKKTKRLILFVCLAVACLIFTLSLLASLRLDSQAWVDSVDFSPDGKTLVVARFRKGMADDYLFRFSPPGSVALYDAKTQQLRHILVSFHSPGTYEPGIYARYSKDGKQIIVQDPFWYADPPTFYDTQDLQLQMGDFNDETTHFLYEAHNPEYRLLAKKEEGHSVTIIEQATNRTRHFQFPLNAHGIMFLDWLPGSQVLWLSDESGHSIFWDYNQQKIVARRHFDIRLTCVAINNARDTIAFGREDGSVGTIAVDELHRALKDGTVEKVLK